MLADKLRAAALSAAPTDPYFKNVTLLLPGNGTNGAQNNTFLDSSANTFSITRNGDTTQGTFSPFSLSSGYWSNYFDGSGDYLTASANSAFAFGTGDLTVEFWVYTLATPGVVAGIYDVGTTNTSGRFVIDYYSDQKVKIETAGSTLVSSSTNLPLNSWVHIAAVRSGTTMSLYQNGVRVGTATNSTNFSQNSPWIGQSLDGYAFTGYISNVRVVKGTAVYDPTQASITVPTAPLTNITNTSLLTCQSNRFIDNGTANSGSGFTLTVNGTPSVQAFSPFLPTAAYSASTNGGSGYFDGTGDNLTTSSNTAFNFTGAYTAEMWVYPPNNGDGTAFYHESTSGGFIFYMPSGYGIGLGRNGVALEIVTYTYLKPYSWNHVVAVRDGSNNTAIFLNGARIGTATLSNSYASSGGLMAVGGSAAAGYLNGYAASARLVKGTAVYDPTQTSITVPTAPLTAITNTSLLLNFTNAGIIDNTAKNDLVTVGDAQISTTQSKFGGSSMKFDGSGDQLVAPNSVDQQLGTGAFTIEFWVYVNFIALKAFMGKGTSGSTGWAVGMNAASKVGFYYGSTSVTSSGSLSSSTWTHIAVVREGTGTNQTKIYINGTNDGTATVSTDFNQTDALYVGTGRGGSGDFNGYIDDARITKGIARYTANFTPPAAPFSLQ